MNCSLRQLPAFVVAGILVGVPAMVTPTGLFPSSAAAQSLDDLGDVFDEPAKQEAPPADQAEEDFDPFGGGQAEQAPQQQQQMTQEEAVAYVQKQMDAAAQLRADGKPGQAIAIYSALLQSFTNYIEADFERAKTYVEMKEYNFALMALNRIIDNSFSLSPQLAHMAIVERGKLNLTMQLYEEALNDLNTAIQNEPASSELLMYRGKALVRIGQADPFQGMASLRQAISSLDHAIELDDAYAEAHAERALAHLAVQEFDLAATDAQRAVELDPENPNYLARRGIVLARRADNERLQHDSDIKKVTDDLSSAIDSFNAYLAREGKKERHEFRDAPPETVTPDVVYSEKAAVEMRLAAESDTAEAKRLYQMAIDDANASLRYQDRSWVPIYQRGTAERMLGHLHEAIDSFTHAIKLSQQPNSEIYLRRGIAWYHLGEYARARADFRQAVESQQTPDGRAKFWLGATYAQEGNFWEAIHFYSEALRENPEYKPAYNNRGLAYQQVGEFRRAANDFEELLRRHHGDQIARQRRDEAVRRAEQQGQ